MRAEFLMRQVHETEAWLHWISIKLEAQMHYFVEILEHKVKYAIIYLIHTPHKQKQNKKHFSSCYVINRTFLLFKLQGLKDKVSTLIILLLLHKHYQQNNITRKVN